MAEQRLPTVNGDDGSWGTILNQYLEKEHYNTGSDNVANGGHKAITIRPGTATASTAPLKFSSGTLLTTAEAGAIEFNNDSLYFTITTGTVRRTIAAYNDASGATGDLYYRASGGAFTRLAIGSTNDVLKVTGGLPTWAAPAGGGTPGGSSGQIQFNNASAFGGAAGLTYQSGSSPNVLATAQNSAHSAFEVRGTTSQTANIQEWKDVTPTLLTAIDSAGRLVLGSAGDTNLYRGGANILATDDDFQIKTGKSLKIDGSTSGTATIIATATTGTPTLTLPTSTGALENVAKSTRVDTTGSYTLTTTNVIALANCTGGTITYTLPAASGNGGQRYYIKKTDSSTNAVTINRAGADTIDGQINQVISIQYQCLMLVSDNSSAWYII